MVNYKEYVECRRRQFCPECGGLLITVNTYSTTGDKEVVCSRCGLVIEEEELMIDDHILLKCVLCGGPIYWKGRGRKPKYCKRCAKEMTRLNKLKWYHKNKLEKNKLSKRDVFLLSVQKRAS